MTKKYNNSTFLQEKNFIKELNGTRGTDPIQTNFIPKIDKTILSTS